MNKALDHRAKIEEPIDSVLELGDTYVLDQVEGLIRAGRCSVPENHGAIVTRESEEALWYPLFGAR
jgi:hypothetical protein